MTSLSRRFLKKIVSANALNKFANQWLPPSVTVFMLHRMANPAMGIAGTDPEYLRRCLRYLQQCNFEFISIEDAIVRSIENRLEKKRWIAFSLDDGFTEQINVAGPIFREFNCPVTCFLITGFVDGTLWPWDYQLMYLAQQSTHQIIEVRIADKNYQLELGTPETKELLRSFVRQVAPNLAHDVVQLIASAANINIPPLPPKNMRATTWEEVRAMEKLGMRFGAHSVSHRILSSLDDASLEHEISQSINRLAVECEHPAQVFCYPRGKINEFDRRAIKIVSRHELAGALSAEPGYLDSKKVQAHPNYRYVIPRLPFPNDFDELKLYVSWAQYVRELMAEDPLQKFY